MKQCSMCKNTFEDSQIFCPECGEKLVDVQNKTEQKVIIKETGKATKVILSVLLVIAIGIAGLSYYELQNYEDKYYDEWSENIDLSNELDRMKVKLERYSDLEGLYGYASDNFYAEKEVLVLKTNMARHIKIKANISGDTTYYFRASTSSTYVNANWGDWVEDKKIEFFFVGKVAGYYTVTFTNSTNDETFDVLFIVKD